MGVAHSTNEPHIEAGNTSTHKSISSEAKRGHKREVRPTVGHHFESSTVQGGARAHFGDRHGDQHHYPYAESSARDSIIDDGGSGATERLRKALAFSEMNYRFMTINHPSPQTCRWFFETPEYTRWRDQEFQRKHHGLLWVKGKPGSGKSTITKCALEHARETYIQEKTIYFFFNARGKTLLEKTTQGMFRSLLYQMAEDVPWLLRAVDLEAAEMYKKQGWPLELLKSLFREAICQFTENSQLSCYVDALDEGEDADEVRDMVSLLEELLETAAGNKHSLSVYLASRHHPNISVANSEEIILDDNEEHQHDIEVYARSKLKCKQAALKEELINAIIQRSSGVFLWVVLVIRDLNKESDRGNQHRLLPRLQQLPNGLDDLFRGMFDADENDNSMLPAIQWVMFAYDALTPLQLYFAVLTSTDPGEESSVIWDRSLVNEATAKDFIVASSKGLLEVVINDRKLHIVQFIHESVRQHLLTSGLRQLDPDSGGNLIGRSHAHLARLCEGYLEASFRTNVINDEHANELLPFLNYASFGLLRHSEAAAAYAIDAKVPLGDALRMETWLRSVSVKGSGKRNRTLLHTLVQKGCKNLTEQLFERFPAHDTQKYVHDCDHNDYSKGYGTPLQFALDRHSLSSDHISDNIKISEMLLEHGANADLAGKKIIAPLHLVVSSLKGRASVKMITALIKHRANLDLRSLGVTALYHAARHSHLPAVKALLRHGANPDFRDDMGDSALHVAARGRRTKILDQLLRHSAEVNSRNKAGVTPLHLIVEHGRAQTAMKLLNHGADVNAQDQDGNSSLHLAVRRGRVETTRTLLFYGADVYSRHRGGKSVMDIAQECDDGKEWERRIIIQLLSYFSDVPTTARFEAGRALEAKDWWREYRDRYTLGGAEDQRAAATASRSTRPTQPSPPQRPSKTPPSPPPPSP